MRNSWLPSLDIGADVTLADPRCEDEIVKSLAEHGGAVRVTRAGAPLGIMVSVEVWEALQAAEATFAQLRARYEELLEESTIAQFVRERESEERTPGAPERVDAILAAYHDAESRSRAASAPE